MRQTMLAVLLTLALPSIALAQVSNLHSGAITAAVEKGVNDPARQADKADDARRKVGPGDDLRRGQARSESA